MFARSHLPLSATLLALGLALGCAEKSDQLVLVDVIRDVQVGEVDSVEFQILQAKQPVSTKTVPWQGAMSGPLKVGLRVSTDLTGEFEVNATGFLSRKVVGYAAPAKVTLHGRGSSDIVKLTILAGAPPVTRSADGGISAPMGQSDGRPRDPDSGAGPEADVPGKPSSDPDARAANVDGAGPDRADQGPIVDSPSVIDSRADSNLDSGANPGTIPDTAPDAVPAMWTKPENVENDLLQREYRVEVAANRLTGDAVLVFEENGSVKALSYQAGTKVWGTPKVLDNRGSPDRPTVAVDRNNKAITIWANRSSEAALLGIWVSHSADGGNSWTPPIRIHAGSNSYTPSVAISPSGRARAVFEQGIANINRVYTTYFDGANWSPATQVLDAMDTSNSREVSVVIDNVGSGFIGWQQPAPTVTDGYKNHVYVAQFTGATLAAPRIISTHNYYSENLTTALTPTGDKGFLVWTQRYENMNGTEIVASRFAPSDGFTAPVQVQGLSSITWPRLAIDDRGGATVAFSIGLANNRYQAAATRFDPAGGWGMMQLLEQNNLAKGNSNDYEQLLHHNVASDATGNTQVVWRKVKDDPALTIALVARQFVVGKGWQPEVTIAEQPKQAVSWPISIATTSTGISLVPWIFADYTQKMSDPNLYNIFVSFFR